MFGLHFKRPLQPPGGERTKRLYLYFARRAVGVFAHQTCPSGRGLRYISYQEIGSTCAASGVSGAGEGAGVCTVTLASG